MAQEKEIICRCGSGLPASTRGYEKGILILTRCAKCESSNSDELSVNAVVARQNRQ